MKYEYWYSANLGLYRLVEGASNRDEGELYVYEKGWCAPSLSKSTIVTSCTKVYPEQLKGHPAFAKIFFYEDLLND